MKILIFLLATIFSAKAVTFTCSFGIGALVNIGNGIYYCYARVSNINDASRNLTAVYGTHFSGRTNADVKLLDILDQPSVTFIAKGIEKFFPNLIAIRFVSTNISTLTGDELEAFDDLELFVMQSNQHLERIPGNFFSANPKMHSIFFSFNNIKRVGENLFNGIEGNLISLSFGSNYCVNQREDNNTAAISSLIQHIKTNCSDIEQETTSTTLTTTLTTTSVSETSTSTTTTLITTSAPSCGEMSEIVCTLKEQNQILITKIENLSNDNEELKNKIEENSIKNSQENVEIKEEVKKLTAENEEIKKMMNEVLTGIYELSTRPCG